MAGNSELGANDPERNGEIRREGLGWAQMYLAFLTP